jgi:hypothetical protein
MAENNWFLQDGRTILVEFEASATATNCGWWGRSSGEGLEFATPAAEWTNHAWLRGGQYDVAAETGGAATITGTFAVTEAQDTFEAVGDVAHVGTLAVTETQDTFAASGDVAHVGTLSVTEAQDTFASSGSVAHVGTLAVTESQDIFAASGDVAHVGTLAVTESQDTFEASGTVTSFATITGTLEATETQDSFEATGSTTIPVIAGGGGGSATVYKIKPKFRKKQYHFLDEDIVEIYEELSKNPETKVEAKKIVKPYIKNQEIDYSRLIENVDKIEQLLALYKELKQIEEDDEILMLMYG